MEREYISIKEFAARAGVSRQAVYARLDQPEVKKFVKLTTVDGRERKLIDTRATGLFCPSDSQEEQRNLSKEVVKKQDKNYNLDIKEALLRSKDSEIETLKALLEKNSHEVIALRQQISDKNRMIDKLIDQNSAQGKSIIDQAKEITRLLDQQQQLQQTMQTLMLRRLPEQGQIVEAEREQPKEKRGFWQRWKG